MADHRACSSGGSHSMAPASDHPVRSRWTPKPEQVLILESIFNSGMVNPPKEETVRIRMLLERFGAVGDANVFYWFQNRRSRSRRRQRQIQAALNGELRPPTPPQPPLSAEIIRFDHDYSTATPPPNPNLNFAANSANSFPAPESSSLPASGDLFSFPIADHQQHHPEFLQYDANPNFCLPDQSDLQNYQPEVMTVFINGIATEVVRGAAVDVKAMFGVDAVLFHSSGVPLEVNEYGYLAQSLQHGESYFLVPIQS